MCVGEYKCCATMYVEAIQALMGLFLGSMLVQYLKKERKQERFLATF